MILEGLRSFRESMACNAEVTRALLVGMNFDLSVTVHLHSRTVMN